MGEGNHVVIQIITIGIIIITDVRHKIIDLHNKGERQVERGNKRTNIEVINRAVSIDWNSLICFI